MHLPEIDRARLAESALRVRLAQAQREIALRDAEDAVRAESERHRVVVEEMFQRHGLAPGVDLVDADTGLVTKRQAPPAPPAPPAPAVTDAAPPAG